MKIVGLIYGVSILISWGLIRIGYAIDEDIKEQENTNMRFWFAIMFIPVFNLISPMVAIIKLIGKKKIWMDKLESFLKHFFLSKKKIEEMKKNESR